MGCLDVVNCELGTLERPGGDATTQPGAEHDRAGGSGRCQLHDAEVLAGAVVDINLESGLLGVEGLGAVHIRDGDDDQLEFPIHGNPSFRLLPNR
jgi:hypothetical protein